MTDGNLATLAARIGDRDATLLAFWRLVTLRNPIPADPRDPLGVAVDRGMNAGVLESRHDRASRGLTRLGISWEDLERTVQSTIEWPLEPPRIDESIEALIFGLAEEPEQQRWLLQPTWQWAVDSGFYEAASEPVDVPGAIRKLLGRICPFYREPSYLPTILTNPWFNLDVRIATEIIGEHVARMVQEMEAAKRTGYGRNERYTFTTADLESARAFLATHDLDDQERYAADLRARAEAILGKFGGAAYLNWLIPRVFASYGHESHSWYPPHARSLMGNMDPTVVDWLAREWTGDVLRDAVGTGDHKLGSALVSPPTYNESSPRSVDRIIDWLRSYTNARYGDSPWSYDGGALVYKPYAGPPFRFPIGKGRGDLALFTTKDGAYRFWQAWIDYKMSLDEGWMKRARESFRGRVLL